MYHVPGDRNYRQRPQENKDKTRDTRVCFKSQAEAEKGASQVSSLYGVPFMAASRLRMSASGIHEKLEHFPGRLFRHVAELFLDSSIAEHGTVAQEVDLFGTVLFSPGHQ